MSRDRKHLSPEPCALGLPGYLRLGCAFCYTGFVMAGSFTGSNPEQIEHWRRVAHIYLVLTGICAIAALAIIVALYRRGERVQPTARRF